MRSHSPSFWGRSAITRSISASGISVGSAFDAPIHHFDIFATAAAAAGAPLPQDREIDGVDLQPYLRGEREGPPHERLFWRTGHYQVVIADGWKLQVTERPGTTWLFNLEDDPTEQVNLAAWHPDRVRAMRDMLARHNSEQQPPTWPSLLESPVSIDRTLREPDQPGDDFIYWAN